MFRVRVLIFRFGGGGVLYWGVLQGFGRVSGGLEVRNFKGCLLALSRE